MRTLIAMAATGIALVVAGSSTDPWTEDELETVRSLALAAPLLNPSDPTNRYADNPAAAELGRSLFFDQRLSANGRVSCGTCHSPERDFQDGKPLGEGVGTTGRRTMPIASTAHSTWLFWDGRKDSQWSQALGPLESPVEHALTRAQLAHLVRRYYREEYEATFGALPDLAEVPQHAGPVDDPLARAAWDQLDRSRQDEVNRVFANVGKAIAAYERTLSHAPTRFDRFAAALVSSGRPPGGVLTRDEIAGARLFVGKGGCINCHNGPLFTDDYFHNTGVPARPGAGPDEGRRVGTDLVVADEFNCRGRYSDAAPEECAELDFIVADSEEMVGAFKTPSLRNVAERAPYMHAGQLATLEDVVGHYRRAPRAPVGHSELRPLDLSRREVDQLVAFLRTLSGPLALSPAIQEPAR